MVGTALCSCVRLNGDKLPSAYDGPGEWVDGDLDFDNSNASNWDITRDLMKSPLWPYCGNSAGIWRRPADKSTVQPTTGGFKGQTVLRIRSICMNAWYNSTDALDFGSGFLLYKKMSDLVDPGPSMTWAFVDEREDSINDGEFVVGMTGFPNQPQLWRIVDYPASYHNRAGGFSFADGHSEIRKWKDPRTIPVLRSGQKLTLNVVSANNPDSYWMMERTTRKVQ